MKLKVKKWGNSLGAVLPRELVKQIHLKDGSTLEVLVVEKTPVPLNKIFGTFSFRKSGQQLKELMREGW